MKYLFILPLALLLTTSQAQTKLTKNSVIISAEKKNTQVSIDENGALIVNVALIDVKKFEKAGYVSYSDFGAKGDGETDDIVAIAGAHSYANKNDFRVKTKGSQTYYIGKRDLTAIIQTDTDFGASKFIIDDTNLENRETSVFSVNSEQNRFPIKSVSSLKKNQKKIEAKLPGPCLITVTNSNVKHYIRFGLNQNNGSSQTDIFKVDSDGNVDPNTPIIWDFEQITEILALPIDQDTLTIKGGHFTTIANQAESKYNYHSRNIDIRRSNVIVEGIKHDIIGEGNHGAPYRGFISISDCSNVTVRDVILTGHKTYRTIGRAGKPVSMGSYDISVGRALNISFLNCSQTNDINDRTYWGIMGSNYCKNLLFDGCKFSRFDAHKGVANATIRNSELGHMGINAIGCGLFTVENTTIRGSRLINLRQDYGSTWQGEFIIRNCIFVPSNGKRVSSSLISGNYTGQHDFGYQCYMPEKITIENLKIDDSNHPEDYMGPAIFSNFNKELTSRSYVEKFPYIKTKEVILVNVKTSSGKKLRVSDNAVMFDEVIIKD